VERENWNPTKNVLSLDRGKPDIIKGNYTKITEVEPSFCFNCFYEIVRFDQWIKGFLKAKKIAFRVFPGRPWGTLAKLRLGIGFSLVGFYLAWDKKGKERGMLWLYFLVTEPQGVGDHGNGT